MATNLTMPQLGLTMTEGTVSQWLKKVGDPVTKGEGVVEVETDKISNVVEAHEDGVLLQIMMQEGESGPVKSVMGVIGQPGEQVAPAPAEETVVAPTISSVVPGVSAQTATASGQKSILIVGAGPGGYVTAIKAAQMGAKVSLIEADKVGGTCLNVGCIPTKALIHVSSTFSAIKEQSAKLGITVSGMDVDWAKAQQYKGSIVKTLVGGVEGLLKANGVAVYRDRGIVKDAHTIQVGSKTLTADCIILAVGSEPVRIPIPGADLPGVIDSTGTLALTEIPKSFVIIGGGVIGIEFASLFASLGTKCTIVEALPRILPPIDAEITRMVRADLEARGIAILTDARVESIEQAGASYTVHMNYQGQAQTVEGEKVLMCVGRRAMTQGIGLEEAGIVLNRGKVVTDDHFQTNVPGIYAIGDCNGKLMLAHAASAQGIAAVNHIMTGRDSYHAETVPSCIYLEPEVASVGRKEEELQEQGIAYRCGTFSLSGNGKALIEAGGKGMIKILADAKYGQILGVHIYGPRATDLIAAAAIAIRLEATVDEFTSTVWAHPTVGEALGEAAEAVFGNSIHWPPKKK